MVTCDVSCWRSVCHTMHLREDSESPREAGMAEGALSQNNGCQTTSIGWRAKVHLSKYVNLHVSITGPGLELRSS